MSKNGMSKLIKNVLDRSLKNDANSTSCVIVFQPKAPEKLNRFKKNVDVRKNQ